jgi:KDO2-lipid IV(A) lauroyltransferase
MRDLIVYWGYRFLNAVVGPLPPRVGYWVARRAGWLIYYLSPRLRRVLSHNVCHVLGRDADSASVQATVRRICVNIAKGHYELFRVSRLSLAQIGKMTDIRGMDCLYEALEEGRGAIILTAHFGNVDMMGQLPLAHGIPISGAVERVRPERLFQYTRELRQTHGVRLIPSDGPMIGLFRALRRNEIIALPCDKAVADNVRSVEFFDAMARLPDGPVRVAVRTGAPLIPAFVYRLPDDSFRVEVEPPLALPDSGEVERDIAVGMEMVVDVMERHISQHPEQWLVAVPVWPLDEGVCSQA